MNPKLYPICTEFDQPRGEIALSGERLGPGFAMRTKRLIRGRESLPLGTGVAPAVPRGRKTPQRRRGLRRKPQRIAGEKRVELQAMRIFGLGVSLPDHGPA